MDKAVDIEIIVLVQFFSSPTDSQKGTVGFPESGWQQ
jgi:hypothetical protein